MIELSQNKKHCGISMACTEETGSKSQKRPKSEWEIPPIYVSQFVKFEIYIVKS